MNAERVGLVLSGGAARGSAHVGALQVLDEAGIAVNCIAGVSAGSVVGAVYAAGLRGDALRQVALNLRWRQFTRPVWPRNGFVSFARIEPYLASVVGDLSFQDLQIPFAALAVDLETCQPIVLDTGRVAPAVRASCSIPGIVAPVELDGCLLADGGMVNNLPISVVRRMGADVVIAVNLVTCLGRRPRGTIETLTVAIETLIARAGDDPNSADVCIQVPLHGLGSLVRLSRGEQNMRIGREAAEHALPRIRAALA